MLKKSILFKYVTYLRLFKSRLFKYVLFKFFTHNKNRLVLTKCEEMFPNAYNNKEI